MEDKKSESNQISHPSHYCFGKYEPVKVIQDWELSFCLGNVVKYLARAGRKEYRGVLKVASKQIPCGIYAVEKDGFCELRKDTFDSKEELKKAVSEYAAKGIKAHYNL